MDTSLKSNFVLKNYNQRKNNECMVMLLKSMHNEFNEYILNEHL